MLLHQAVFNVRTLRWDRTCIFHILFLAQLMTRETLARRREVPAIDMCV
jgi:hypothetical protein